MKHSIIFGSVPNIFLALNLMRFLKNFYIETALLPLLLLVSGVVVLCLL